MSRDDGRKIDLFAIFGRYKYVIAIAAIGALLLMWPRASDEPGIGGESPLSVGLSDKDTLEAEIEEILAKMYGVGRVDVLLTLESGGEKVLASDSTLRYSGNPQNPNDYDRSSETVTVSEGGGTGVVVTQERSAKYRGALVVCDGGDNDKIRLKVIEAVCALTGLGSDRVAVVRWGSENVGAKTGVGLGEELS